MRPEDSTLIGIDWGTSRLRAFRIGNEGQILDRRRSDRGIAGLSDGGFEPALWEILAGWPADVPILMCGMVGSRQGWREVPYQHCPARAQELANSLAPVATRVGTAWIVGGLTTMEHQNDSHGRHPRTHCDVMRGEETLIVGAALSRGDALVIAPGTHSKWAMIQAGTIERFRTCMTGEMYGLLRRHSILGRLMQEEHEVDSEDGAFLEGIRLGLDEPALLHSLFSVRTQALFARIPQTALAAYLSGILIGSEVAGEARHLVKGASTIIIAGPELGRLYQVALAAGGFGEVGLVDAEAAVARGLWILWHLRGAAS